MKKAKNILTLAALGLGMCVGVGVAFTPDTAQAVASGAVAMCQGNEWCDYFCGEGLGRCNPAGWCECM